MRYNLTLCQIRLNDLQYAFMLSLRISANLGVRSDLQTPATIYGMCSIKEVSHHLQPLFDREAHPGDVRPDDQTRKKEHGTSVFAWPVAIVRLELFEKIIAILCSFDW
jgi:hypothetical protein